MSIEARHAGLPGSESRASVQGFPRNLGEPVSSFRKLPERGTGRANPRPLEPSRRTQGSEANRDGRYRRVKENETRGDEGRQSERPSSTNEGGEPKPRGPSGGKGGVGLWNYWRERHQTCQSLIMSQRNNDG